MSEEVVEKKPWQMGYDLDKLKQAAAPFKESIKEYCNGAFGCPKERDVAKALADGNYRADKAHDAALIVRKVGTKSVRHDFAGRDIPIQAGDTFCSAWGWRAGKQTKGLHLLEKTIKEAGFEKEVKTGFGLNSFSATFWVEVHEERPWVREILEGLGFQWAAAKVSAGSDTIGLYVKGPGAEAAIERCPDYPPEQELGLGSLITSWLKNSDIQTIREEVVGVQKHFAQHYSSYNKRHSWTALALKGYADDPTFIIKPAEMSKKWKAENEDKLGNHSRWTVLTEMMPHTMRMVSRLPGGTPDRVRFMRLAPDGELTRHADITDRDAGVDDGKLVRLHIPIITSEGCRFRSWGLRGAEQRGHMPLGGLCYLDQRKPHACKNESPGERIHFVADVAATPTLRKVLRNAKPL